jgi:plasmid stabilization system protein ParE
LRKLAEALLHAGTGPEQGRTEDEAHRSPPRCPESQRLGFERTHHHISFLHRPNRQDVYSRWHQEKQIQAYCRRLVNQNKRTMAIRRGPIATRLPQPFCENMVSSASIVA